MILQALKNYYDRKAQDPDAQIAPPGFEWKEIPFIIVLDLEGRLIQIEDTRTVDGKRKISKSYLVPQGEKRANGVKPNRLWDNPEYIFGINGKIEKQKAFITRLEDFLGSADEGLLAMKQFLSGDPLKQAKTSEVWCEIEEDKPFLAFRLKGDIELICQRPKVISALESEGSKNQGHSMVCLVTGNKSPAGRLHPSIKGVKDAQPSGANILSFNCRAFESYGKEERRGENAPISEPAVLAYTTALNHLLGKESSQKIQVGDATTVFWAKQSNGMEKTFLEIFGEPDRDNPDKNVKAVEDLYRSAQNGAFVTNSDTTEFYVLGLSPNIARISIRFWHVGTVAELSERIRKHFNDLEIVHPPWGPRFIPLYSLLKSISVQGKEENIPPDLAGDIMRSILSGGPYPELLLQAAVRRIRIPAKRTTPKEKAEAYSMDYVRAALIKACINRRSNKEEITVSLDEGNTCPAYRLGRLFAVLERIQERASPNLNATIRDRFYGAASSTPGTVFPTLLKLKNHHVSKLENKGEAVNFEKLVGAIMSGVDEFPFQLTLQDQGRFAIGYYHQRQAMFSKTNNHEKGE
ncbi:MAG: type I-C CRISPR-associated protein Cas8c/Csd1 [Leptospirales bacterium]